MILNIEICLFDQYWKMFVFKGGIELCDVTLMGVRLFVTKCDEGEGESKIGKNRVTSFMDDPLSF